LKTVLVIFLIAFGAESTLYAQSTADSFFPLSVGNAWTFINSNVLSVEKEIEHGGQDWVVLSESCDCLPILFGDTLRTDVSGNIWHLEAGAPQLLFKFSDSDASDYEVIAEFIPDSPPDTFHVEVSRPDSINISGSVFQDVVRLYFIPAQGRDGNIEFLFVRSIGLVKQANIWFGTELREATIQDETIAVRNEIPTVFRTVSGPHVFPNPVRGDGTVVLQHSGGAAPRAAIHDILGREVSLLLEGSCNGSTCSYSFETDKLSAGLHFVVFASNGVTQVAQFIALDE
jgi:hypothetical protein